ncbi:Sterol desaturase/sphingolipid hydroxylase, fatty acid hydroxylase superfamily [Geosmithia morbida]|uniref:Sterol desaturase/sphingolipid hydroxylase, fatty acid hydroxylase superfamily n=1 Tax=Geosmithia morbida TaxID=1094350 RepID=A0A9P4YTE4_9HYPO|nr:Sterol desaturase/sphingolipid hydroxylase, fatty acid hydroxylase superfamily [Geosmithia morbida]KAF4120674.1 Sterol desaturase/sphingolipid hydroxylase, fatty acid hydroxylase superfamily [Geosmithia morbida]
MATTAKMRNPKDSMKSDWYTALPRDQWTWHHWFYHYTGVYKEGVETPVPIYQKTERVPYVSDWTTHGWITAHIATTIFLNHLYVVYTGHNLSAVAAFFFYSLAFKITAIHEMRALRYVGHMTGYLDGDAHARDGVPNVGVEKVVWSLLSTSTFRPIFTLFLSWRTAQAPADANWLLVPLETGLYIVTLDFWFYWYHRLMHEVDWLWRFHRTHHLTKHPNPLLTLYADTVQELFDVAGIPLMSYFSLKAVGLPMGFYEWWFAHQFVMFTELVGHSGLRIVLWPPNPLNPLIRLFGLELIIEDHDIHHRKGWKRSGNYGKQTRIWDSLFGTNLGRIECQDSNIDWKGEPVSIPMFFRSFT